METSQNKKRFTFKRSHFFRVIFLLALAFSVLVHNVADAELKVQNVATTDEESPYLSDDYDPIDYLPPGLPPSNNDPANEIKAVN